MSDAAPSRVAEIAVGAEEDSRYEAADVVRHLAHELRQPLSTIESIAYYLEMILPQAEGRARAQAGKLQQMVHQCNWILADAIHYLQASPPRPELVDLSEIVSQTLAEWSKEDNSLIRYEPAENLPLLRLDVAQVQHLLCNLFTFYERVSRGKPVIIRAQAAAGEVCLEIAAPAPGYEADSMKSLFQPFAPHLPGGSGLALASVRRIAEAHGASIRAQWDSASGMLLKIAFPLPH